MDFRSRWDDPSPPRRENDDRNEFEKEQDTFREWETKRGDHHSRSSEDRRYGYQPEPRYRKYDDSKRSRNIVEVRNPLLEKSEKRVRPPPPSHPPPPPGRRRDRGQPPPPPPPLPPPVTEQLLRDYMVTRTYIRNILHRPYLEVVLQDCFVRYVVGVDSKDRNTYEIGMIEEVIEDPRHEYVVEGKRTTKYVRLNIGGKIDKQALNLVSNSPFSREEFKRFLNRIEESGCRPKLTTNFIRNKINKVKEIEEKYERDRHLKRQQDAIQNKNFEHLSTKKLQDLLIGYNHQQRIFFDTNNRENISIKKDAVAINKVLKQRKQRERTSNNSTSNNDKANQNHAELMKKREKNYLMKKKEMQKQKESKDRQTKTPDADRWIFKRKHTSQQSSSMFSALLRASKKSNGKGDPNDDDDEDEDDDIGEEGKKLKLLLEREKKKREEFGKKRIELKKKVEEEKKRKANPKHQKLIHDFELGIDLNLDEIEINIDLPLPE